MRGAVRPSGAWGLVLLGIAGLILVACGGGDSVIEPSSVDVADSVVPSGEAIQFSDAVSLSRVFPAILAGRPLYAAWTPSAAASLDNVVRPNGTTWDPDVLASEVGLSGLYRVVYGAPDAETLDVVRMDVARFRDAEGATRFLDILRAEPLDEDEERVDPPAGVLAASSLALVLDLAKGGGGGPSPLFATTDVRGAALIMISGNVAVRVVVMGREALETAAAVALAQLARLERAVAGTVLAEVERPFRVPAAVDLAAQLPAQLEGYDRVSMDVGIADLTATYDGPAGAFAVVQMNIFDDPAVALTMDFVMTRTDVLRDIFQNGDSPLTIVTAEALALADPAGEVWVAERWQVTVEDLPFASTLVMFRRGAVWTLLQVLQPRPEGDPAAAMAVALDALLDPLTP